MGPLRAALASVVALAGLSACGAGDGKDQVGGDRATATLERQRTDVRAAARTLLLAAERTLDGRTTTSAGGWRGCESAGVEEYRNFRYLAQARVDAGPADPTPYLAALRKSLAEAGFARDPAGATPGPGRSSRLVGTREDLTAVFSHARGAFVGVDVYGPCVDVPPTARGAWLRRDEPTPDLLGR